MELLLLLLPPVLVRLVLLHSACLMQLLLQVL
jgi:hypothetical protein